jgi:hypothetical protein
MQVTAHFHLVMRLKMSGAIPLISPYAFMVQRGITSPSCPCIPGIYILVWWTGITCNVLLFRCSQYLDRNPVFKGLLVGLMLQLFAAFWVVEHVHIVSFLCVNVEVNFCKTQTHTHTHSQIYIYIPYFLIDNTHPKLFQHSFCCIDNVHDAN